MDANVRLSLGARLQELGHDVRNLAGSPEHDLSDEAVLALAYQEERLLITNDKDFGPLIFLRRQPHHGIILFRLTKETSPHYLEKLDELLTRYQDKLPNHFIVVTDDHFRFR